MGVIGQNGRKTRPMAGSPPTTYARGDTVAGALLRGGMAEGQCPCEPNRHAEESFTRQVDS